MSGEWLVWVVDCLVFTPVASFRERSISQLRAVIPQVGNLLVIWIHALALKDSPLSSSEGHGA
jgi:hypothetical protein